MRYTMPPMTTDDRPPESVNPRLSFLQSRFWAGFKAGQGWKSFFVPLPPTGDISVLARLLGGRFCLAYVPFPPLPAAAKESAVMLAEITKAAARALGENLPGGAFLIRYDLGREFSALEDCAAWKEALCAAGSGAGLRNTLSTVQPPDTVILNIDLSEEELLARMKSKWRYNIGISLKRGVTVRLASGDSLAKDLAVFYSLYQETAARDRIAIHSRGYYESLFGAAEKSRMAAQGPEPDVRLYVASHEGEDLAAIITLFYGGEAVYLYGASSNSKRNLMAAYLLQWQAIRDAKTAGCVTYDFYGIPPTEHESHPMHGLYRFKTGFGGRIVHRPGCVDAPLSPIYPLYTLAETARAFYHKRLKKALLSR
jgi:lipid II:glycine glycyltransferase (peptidoglycan interpeptide bridge formation enzyme)